MSTDQANGIPPKCEDSKEDSIILTQNNEEQEPIILPFHKRDTNWLLVLFYIYLHLTAIYSVFLILFEAHWATSLMVMVLSFIIPLGMTMGAHRLWAHNAFQASTTLRAILIILNTLAAQGSVYDWVLEHRLHHRLRGTSLDPFDARRGFVFAHLNHRLVRRDPRLEEEQKKIDMSDLEKDSIIMFQKKFYCILMPIFLFFLVNAPVEYWGESLLTSFCVVGIMRHVFILQATSFIHSGPIIWGLKTGVNEADSNLVFFIQKSRWPDYHYMLPWDYRTSEYGCYGTDWTSMFIEKAAKLGWATNLRTCSEDTMKEAVDFSLKENVSIKESIEKIIEQKKQQ